VAKTQAKRRIDGYIVAVPIGHYQGRPFAACTLAAKAAC